MRFEWDPRKAQANKRKHGVTFEEAATCFADEHGRYYEEIEASERFILIAVSTAHRLIFSVHAELEKRSHSHHQRASRHATRTETL
jgi:uncharacterized DUF497 family protein